MDRRAWDAGAADARGARARGPGTVGADLVVTPALSIPASELRWRFSRSSGPGGQHVNTSDSRVQLSWSIADSTALTDDQRAVLLTRVERPLVDGVVTVTASEQRSQLRNRETAARRLAAIVEAALAPDGPRRRATKATRGAHRRRLAAKAQRSTTKQQRRRPPAE